MKRPIDYAIYKGVGGKFGAIQFGPILPRQNEQKIQKGALLIEMAPTLKPDVYDWANKLNIALTIDELGSLLYFLDHGKDVSGKAFITFFHDPAKAGKEGEAGKSISFNSPRGLGIGMMVNLIQGDKKYVVGMTGAECKVLKVLITHIIPRFLNW